MLKEGNSGTYDDVCNEVKHYIVSPFYSFCLRNGRCWQKAVHTDYRQTFVSTQELLDLDNGNFDTVTNYVSHMTLSEL